MCVMFHVACFCHVMLYVVMWGLYHAVSLCGVLFHVVLNFHFLSLCDLLASWFSFHGASLWCVLCRVLSNDVVCDALIQCFLRILVAMFCFLSKGYISFVWSVKEERLLDFFLLSTCFYPWAALFKKKIHLFYSFFSWYISFVCSWKDDFFILILSLNL